MKNLLRFNEENKLIINDENMKDFNTKGIVYNVLKQRDYFLSLVKKV